MPLRPSRSFDSSGQATVADEDGRLVHAAALEHRNRLQREMYVVRPGVWCLVGNGLSNQTFIEGPDGIIAIDTGESVQEMTSALDELRRFTDRPVVAAMYTHFHYVAGTAALPDGIPIYGHHRIDANRRRVGGQIGPTYSRGLVYQFGTSLPADGPDGLVSVGLGLHYRNAEHAPFTNGYRPVTEPLAGGERLTVAGLSVEATSAPSDADDSMIFWFPELGVCVHNNVWPVLFNVFAIRGEEYRDPRVLLRGLDHIRSLNPEYLVATHGPPLSGAAELGGRVTRYRDSIQFLWDQTVRAMNRGLDDDAIAATVRLPDTYDDDWLTGEWYGVTEHHVRQIASGLRGWFDGNPARLFPLPPGDRAARLVAGFGGADEVRSQARAAVDTDDLRWALELASWLVALPNHTDDDRMLLADALRAVGQRTAAANIRNWCLTRAGHIDGTRDLERLNRHRLRPAQLAADTPEASVDLLRVLLDPQRAAGLDAHLALRFGDRPAVGLHVRNGIAERTDGEGAEHTVALTFDDWVALLTGAAAWSELVESGRASIDGDPGIVAQALLCFDPVAERHR